MVLYLLSSWNRFGVMTMNMDFSPLWISLKTTILATLLTFFFGIIAAWFVTRYRGKLKGFLDGLLTLPMVLPPTVVGYFLLILLGKNGPIGKLLYLVGVKIIFTWWSAVLAASVVAFPLMYKTARGAFEQVDINIVYAARTLGVSEWMIFWKVIVPLAWPGIVAGAVLAFTRALGEFGATLMVAGNIPGRTQTIPLAIFFSVERAEMNKAFIWVVLIFVVSLAVMILMNYWNEYQRINTQRIGRRKYGTAGEYKKEASRIHFKGKLQGIRASHGVTWGIRFGQKYDLKMYSGNRKAR